MTAASHPGQWQSSPRPLEDTAVASSPDLDATIFGPTSGTASASKRQCQLPPASGGPTTLKTASAPPQVGGRSHITKASSVPSNIRRKKLIVIAAAAVVCAALLLIIVLVLRPETIQPAAATAVVDVPSADLLVAPNPRAKRIAPLRRGMQLNVLKLPSARNQEWVNAQEVGPKVSRAGFVRVTDLRDWRGNTSAADLALARLFSLGEGGNELEIKVEIQRFNELISRFQGAPAAKQARLDIVRFRMALAKRFESAGRSPSESESELQAAQEDLDELRDDSSVQAQVIELNQQIDAFLHKPQAPPEHQQPAVPPQSHDVSALLMARAQRLRLDGDYLGAEQLLERILRMGQNKDAQALANKIRRAREAEQGSQRTASASRKARQTVDDFLNPASGPLAVAKLIDLIRLIQPDIETEGRLLRALGVRNVDFVMTPDKCASTPNCRRVGKNT